MSKLIFQRISSEALEVYEHCLSSVYILPKIKSLNTLLYTANEFSYILNSDIRRKKIRNGNKHNENAIEVVTQELPFCHFGEILKIFN